MKYDQHENCAKCGYPGKTVEYDGITWHGFDGTQTIEETLKLTCSRCGFKWVRDCLDKEEA